MKRKILLTGLMSAFFILSACGHKKDKKKVEIPETASLPAEVTEEGLTKATEEWPQTSLAAINELKAKYGLPDSVSNETVVWEDSAPFKRSVVFREELNHQFPMQHSDVLMQSVDYRVPLDKVSDLTKFDGSLLVDRTKGEISARNEKEAMNILALNLADKIVRGEMTVENARREYSKNAEAFAAGTTNKMISELNFTSEGNTSDPDSMMQSQTEDQPTFKRTIRTEEVKKVIEE